MVTAAAVAAPTAAFLASRVLRSSGGERWGDVETTTADLLPMDKIMLKHSIATVTFFEGDVDVAEAEIGRNCAALLRLNPWLCGRSRLSGGWKGSLTWPTKVDSFAPPPEDVFVRRDIEGLHRNTDFADLFRLLGDRITPPGPTDRNWLVTLVPDSESPTKRFCVVTCINHGVGDGHTYYKCHNMVLGATEPEPLVCERNREAAMKAENMCPTRKEIYFTAPVILGLMFRKLYGRVMGYEPAVRTFEVDAEWLAREKERAPKSDPQVKFVSTNDCISSWFLRQCSQTSGDMPVLGMMAVNFRGRIEGSRNDALAGNYESTVYYLRGDFESPGLIRRSLATMRRCGNQTGLGSFSTRVRTPWSLISNWTSFCLPPKLRGCRELLHRPLVNPEELLPGDALGVVFRPYGNKVALQVTGPRELLDHIEAEASGMRGPPIV